MNQNLSRTGTLGAPETEDDGMGGRSSALSAGNMAVALTYIEPPDTGAKFGVFLLGLP